MIKATIKTGEKCELELVGTAKEITKEGMILNGD